MPANRETLRALALIFAVPVANCAADLRHEPAIGLFRGQGLVEPSHEVSAPQRRPRGLLRGGICAAHSDRDCAL
jgi:hypothetical protein